MSSSASAERHPQTDSVARIPSHKKNVLIYDNCTAHHSTAWLWTAEPGRRTKAPFTSETSGGEQADYDDLPPLGLFDDEDEDDARSFSRYQKESNSWLLFSGALALIITVFITSFTLPPNLQRNAHTNRLIAAQLHQHLLAMAAGVTAQGIDLPFNLTLPPMAPEEPALAREMRDVWVPALCYLSLGLTLVGAMVTLQVKQGLMACTMSVLPLSPPTPDLPSLRAAAARYTEYKKSRKETVHRTEKVHRVIPPILYGAAGCFACGVLVKLGTFAYLQLF